MIRRRTDLAWGALPLEGTANSPLGAGVRFALWAPAARTVSLLLDPDPQQVIAGVPLLDPKAAAKGVFPLTAAGDGWFTATLGPPAAAGARYYYLIDGRLPVPDPASRFQPEDVHGPSEVIDPSSFEWEDKAWPGRPWHDMVFYELHVGSFTPEGTYKAVIGQLDRLASLGVTAIELMPLADWPGRRNWGYDGCYPFAPDSCYGRPDDLKALVQAAHGRNLSVFLDVVYNHFGPEGNYLHLYAGDFFTDRHQTPWGAAINFDQPGNQAVRRFFIDNALHWLVDYNMDGLRLDAVHAIADDGTPHFLDELAKSVRQATGDRHRFLVLENDDNEAAYLAPTALPHAATGLPFTTPASRPRATPGARGGLYDGQWNDDFHHACHVLLTGEGEGYYEDYKDAPLAHLGRCLAEGFAYQGEVSPHRGHRRGSPSGHLSPLRFVTFLQNHDQIGNRAFGERLTTLAPAAALRAAAAIFLLAPSPPLLFMGEEWGETAPFPFFCDFGDELAAAVRDGRRREFARFAAFADPAAQAHIPDPTAAATFRQAVLDPARDATPDRERLYRRLLDLRHRRIVPLLPRLQGAGRWHLGAEGGGVLSLGWPLAAKGGDGPGVLRLKANLSDTPHPSCGALPAPEEGRCRHWIFPDLPQAGPPADTAPLLDPWTVYWWHEEGAR